MSMLVDSHTAKFREGTNCVTAGKTALDGPGRGECTTIDYQRY